VAINGVACEAVRWCDEAGCIDLRVASPEALPTAWVSYEARLPSGAHAETGFTRDIGGPPVELAVGDHGVSSLSGEPAVLCYTVRWDGRDDAITYCWATSEAIP
jgi:hypothetical protein